MTVDVAPDTALPHALPFHRIQEAGWRGWWRPLVGSVCLLLWLFVIAGVVVTIPFAMYYAATGADVSSSMTHLLDTKRPSPATFAWLNLTLASLIPASMLVNRLFHGLSPRWLASVQPRIRWRFLLACFGIAVIALIATQIVGSLVPGQGDDLGHAHAFTTTTSQYVAVFALLTPLQAMGEEYLFRGYLTQAFGSLSHRAWVAVLVSGLAFGIAHGIGQSIPVFFDRFAFGIVAGTLAVMTGGLEAGIAMHVLNNWLAFGLALAFGNLGDALNATGGSWWSIPVTLTQSLVYLGLAVLVARRMGLRTTTLGRVLEAPASRV